MRRALSSLVVGDRIVSRCEGGLLEVEYSLFDPHEVVLSAGEDGEPREHGYLTFARLARERLLDRRIDARLADDAFAALREGHRRALARTPDVLRVIDHLGPYEAFEGGVFSAAAGRYAGAWLDLDALARVCPLRGAGRLMQAMHLLLVLEEVDDDAPVRLLTENATRDCWPDTRTWRRQVLPAPDRLPGVLRAMRLPPRSANRPDPAAVCDELLRNVRARATAATASVPRLLELAALLARGLAAHGQTAPPWTEDPALERLDDLRRHVDVLHGEDKLRAIAQFFSGQAALAGAHPEVASLAARAWLAAGEPGHARHFARGESPTPIPTRAPLASPLSSIPVPLTRLREPPTVPRMRVATLVFPRAAVDAPASGAAADDARAASEPHLAAVCEPLTLAELPAPSRPPVSLRRARRMPGGELVETLEPPALPDGASEDAFDLRLAMTRLARELGHDYRRWYGTRLVADVTAIDTMQRHLLHRFAGALLDDRRWPELELELMRHGALLSEVLARTLDAEWVDTSGRPDDWTMIVPGAGVRGRVAPIARIRRFFMRGHREPDLVAFYVDLETASAMAS